MINSDNDDDDDDVIVLPVYSSSFNGNFINEEDHSIRDTDWKWIPRPKADQEAEQIPKK